MLFRPASLLALLLVGSSTALAATPEQAVEKAHAELWRRFVDEHNLILDYVGLQGEIIRPTPQDCRDMKPSALSWGVPNEDGPMFNGLYLDAACNRWRITQKEEDRAKARRLIDGLLKVSSIGKTPGFIARGIATDGRMTYPLGSNDQTTPWQYGIWRYVTDGLPKDDAEKQDLIAKFMALVKVLDQTGWKMPTDGPPCPYRGDYLKAGWEGVPRILFTLKAAYNLSGDEAWQKRYLAAAQEKIGNNQTPRIETCRTGLVFDPGQGPRHSWTGSEGVVCLRALWEMETDPVLKAAYAEGLRHSAELCAKSLPLIEKFDVNGGEAFNLDWRVMNAAWRPQFSEKDAVDVAVAGLRVQSKASPRLHLEKDYLREPCFAAWVITLCPDKAVVDAHRAAIEKVITHYDVTRVYLSQFFPIESAWWRMKLLER